MIFRRFRAIPVAACATVVLVSACGSQDGAGGSGKAKISLYYSVPTAEQALPKIAMDNKLFPDDCTVEVQGGDSNVGLTLVSSGRVQAYVNASPVPEEVVSGGAPLEWAAMWQEGITTEFIARPGIGSVEDLRGRSIGIINPSGTIWVLANAALRDAGVDPSEVRQLPLGTLPAVNSAFAAGTVDAIVTTKASAEALKAKVAGVTTLVDFSKDFPWVGSGIAVNSDWADENPDAVVCLLTGLNRALELVNEGSGRIRQSIADVTGSSGKELDFAMQTLRDVFTDQLQPVSLELESRVMEVLREQGKAWATEEFARRMIGNPAYVEEAVGGE